MSTKVNLNQQKKKFQFRNLRKNMVQTNIQKLNLESITKFNNNFRHLMSGKLSISLLLKYLIKSNHINPKLNETFVPKFMGNWVYSSILQNSQIGTSLTNYTKILYMYHQLQPF